MYLVNKFRFHISENRPKFKTVAGDEPFFWETTLQKVDEKTWALVNHFTQLMLIYLVFLQGQKCSIQSERCIQKFWLDPRIGGPLWLGLYLVLRINLGRANCTITGDDHTAKDFSGIFIYCCVSNIFFNILYIDCVGYPSFTDSGQ